MYIRESEGVRVYACKRENVCIPQWAFISNWEGTVRGEFPPFFIPTNRTFQDRRLGLYKAMPILSSSAA